jgi:hypothetical protein
MASYKSFDFSDWDLEVAARIRDALNAQEKWRRLSKNPISAYCGPFSYIEGSLDEIQSALSEWTIQATSRCRALTHTPNSVYTDALNCCVIERNMLSVCPLIIAEAGDDVCRFSQAIAEVIKTKQHAYRLAATNEIGWANWEQSHAGDMLPGRELNWVGPVGYS